ncbi:ATP-binding cassette domain-containing protein [Sneathiella chungangensis]|uniref:ATP-binding cassette domain-containing protein n=1 Tax=Sneathiella chungangensis TaxID=1418234 RepID=A0A845M875_9PROT|nr:ABC transporter ATP-binding protein [Sneathiella chungangensis]MZR21043.1 ATP-binding cassette domain-containing protein [Sneathiella chungangensis]
MTVNILTVEKLVKHYDGLLATDELSIDVRDGELHAIIGPNGAGKTTLIKQLTGEISPDSGRITFAGRNLRRLTEPQRSHIGLARSFQITSLFKNFTVLDNVRLAVQAHSGHSFHFWRKVKDDDRLTEPALDILREMGLDDRAETLVANLSHGEQRQLEIAVALATKPKMLLLDEPMAGMSGEDSERLVAHLAKLKSRFSILLVEHDMDAVFSLADRISVLVYGQAIATGTPEEIRSNEKVRQAYLGEEE